VTFIVEDLNGPGDLPGIVSPSDTAPPLVAADIVINLAAPINGIGSGTVRTIDATGCFAIQCADGTNTNCDAATVASGDGTDFTLQKQYTCNVTMQFFDEPAVSVPTVAGDYWNISITARDVADTSDTKNSGDAGFTSLTNDYMEYLTTSAISTVENASWAALDISAVDNPADSELILNSVGNTAVANVTTQGENLTGVNNGAAVMEIAAFSGGSLLGAGNSGACDGPSGGGSGNGATELVDGSPVTISGVSIPFTATGTDSGNLFFCIWAAVDPTYLSGGSDTSYSATAVKGNNWEVLFNA